MSENVTNQPRGTLSKLKNRFSKSFSKESSGGSGTPAKSSHAESTAQAAPTPIAKHDAQPRDGQVAPDEGSTTSTAPVAAPALGADVTGKDQSDKLGYSPEDRSLNGVKSSLRTLHAPHPTLRTGTLKVATAEEGDHELYWEISGKEGGYPVVYLHGGPGGGTTEDDRRWFDPSHYQILVFDQRGSGKSTPAAELKGNTTWDLVNDVEKLRKEVMKVDKWHVFGGSWGSTLSLAYAQAHPDRVSALILRGIFALRRAELEFFYQHGSGWLWPEQFEPFEEHIPEGERSDMIAAYYSRLTSPDPQIRLEAARRWSTWENATSKLYIDDKHIAKGEDDKWALQFARIESHFFHNRGWLEDGQLLKPENVKKILHIPTVVVQGRYDVVCPAKSAWDLRKVWLQLQAQEQAKAGSFEFFLIPDAGHSAREAGIADRLLYATEKFQSITA